MFSIVLTVAGLALFETISSLDNAIINAQVLSTMKPKARRWFLTWGILIAIFVVRGALPFLIVWAAHPTYDLPGTIVATFTGDERAIGAIEQSAPILLAGGGVFLLLLFLHWLFLEEKHYGLPYERAVRSVGLWFYAVASILLTIIVWLAMQQNDLVAFGAVVGSTAFFITHGFKQQAEAKEAELLAKTSIRSDLSKLLYLEVIDATFSIDGVLGAFAFTLSVPLILIGNGLGAIIVRQVTIGNIEAIRRYVFLKNGAMYSILVLGSIMVAHAFGLEVPEWLSPICTITIIGYFFWKSRLYAQALT
jgi:hypothetical protein